MSVPCLDEIDPQQFLERLAISIVKVIHHMRTYENLPTKLTQSLEETEAMLLNEGLHETRIITALGRLGGSAGPSALETETSLSPEEIYLAIIGLNSAGIVVEDVPGVFQLTAMKSMKTAISQWGELVNVSELFNQCKRLIEATNDQNEITNALGALRDALLPKGVSGVVIAEIATEARTWRSGSGDKEGLLKQLATWEERSAA
jgi:hypothetical protein